MIAKILTATVIKIVLGIGVTVFGGMLLARLISFLKPRIALKEALEAVLFVFAFGFLSLIFGATLLKYRQQWITGWLIGIALLLMVVVLSFFRDPERNAEYSTGDVLSPADGVVDLVDEAAEVPGIPGKVKRISIFLSLFNVHVQRSPIAGKLIKLEYVKGKVLPAFLGESSEKNRHNVYYIEGDIPVVIKQISGIIAQRPVSWVKAGKSLGIGERIGLIKFGSRVDVYMPASCELLVDVDSKVKGGLTKIAKY